MVNFQKKESYNVDDLRTIMEILRSDEGCPWDREQNHVSVRKNFLEETYEVLEAIDSGDTELLKEELGDVLMQVVFHARMEEEIGSFNLDDVADGVCKKLILRHPHVFGDVQVENADEVLKNWDAIKKKEKHQESFTETLQNVPKVLPALMRAEKVQHRAARAGVDFADEFDALNALQEKIAELGDVLDDGDLNNLDEVMGDIFFDCVNVVRFFHVDSEKCLTKATETFINRFRRVEELAAGQSMTVDKADSDTLARLWNQAEDEEKTN